MTTDTFGRKQPSGLGGWLILPMLGLIIGPVLAVFSLVVQTLPMLEVAGQLPPHQAAFIYVEMGINLFVAIVAPLVLLVLMLQKKATFPGLYQLFLAGNLIWVVANLTIAYLLFKDIYDAGVAEFWDRETVRALSQSIIGAAIWIPYMARSVRVRNTFLN